MMVYNGYPVAPWGMYNNLIFPRKARIINSSNRLDYIFPDLPRARNEGGYEVRGVTSYCFNIMENGEPSDTATGPAIQLNTNGSVASITNAIAWMGYHSTYGSVPFIMPSITLKSKVKSSYWYSNYDSSIHVRSVNLNAMNNITHWYPSSWSSTNTPTFIQLDSGLYAGVTSGTFTLMYPTEWMVIKVRNIYVFQFGHLGGVSNGFSGDTIQIDSYTQRPYSLGLSCPNKTSVWAGHYHSTRSDAGMLTTYQGVYYTGVSGENGSYAYIRQLSDDTFFIMTKNGLASENLTLEGITNPCLMLSRPVLGFNRIDTSKTAHLTILAFGQDFYKLIPPS